MCFGAAENKNISEMDYPALISGDTVRAKVAVQSFVQLVCKEMNLYHAMPFNSHFHFSQYSQKFSTIDKWTELWTAVFVYLEKDEVDMQLDCLSMLRILSRDKTHMDEVITEKNIRILMRLANLLDSTSMPIIPEDSVIVESLKCLCNLVFNSETCQSLFDRLNGVDGIVKRVRSYK